MGQLSYGQSGAYYNTEEAVRLIGAILEIEFVRTRAHQRH
jgi:hypothetical protein